MAVDTEAKRWSMLAFANGPVRTHVFNPDTSGLSNIEKITTLLHYGGNDWDEPVIVVEEDVDQPTGGYGARNYYDSYLQRKRREEKKRRELMAQLAKLEGVDREIARIMQKDLLYDERTEQIAELGRLIEEADVNAQRREFQAMNQKLANAFTRAYMELTFSAIESFERQLEQALEEEEFMMLAIAVLQ